MKLKKYYIKVLRVAYFFIFILLLLGCATLPLTSENLKSSVLSKQLAEMKGFRYLSPKEISDTFNLEGTVYLTTVFRWPEIDKGRGSHDLVTRWYAGEDLVSEVKDRLNFNRSPYLYHVWIHTLSLGVGRHSVELLVDGVVLMKKEFTIIDE